MPSPIGHGLAGLTVHVLASRGASELRAPVRAVLVVGAAILPDIDLLFFFVDGRNHHNRETHSLGAAILAAAALFLLARGRRWPRPGALAVAVGAAWMTHVLLDYLNRDTTLPVGIMAFWPFDAGFYKSPWPLFLDIGRTLDWATVGHDAVAALWEFVVLTPLLLGAWRVRYRERV
jgi:membrane-bound metal-dependent hydrolase YbcI (DUF457 family)